MPRHAGFIPHGVIPAVLLPFNEDFSIDEAKDADEAFITSASAFVMPVVQVDGADVGTGKPGHVAARLREIYLDEMRKAAV